MIFRQNPSVLGGSGSPYLLKGEWQYLAGYRGLNSEQHYSGDLPNPEITSGVVNTQHIVDHNVTYAPSRQLNLSVNVPYVNTAFSLLLGSGANRKRHVQRMSGIGDIVVSGRYWLMDSHKHSEGNVACELGFKLPTGRHDARDTIVGRSGEDPQPRPVDQSIQPGDGGFGVLLGLSGFKPVGSGTLYLSGTYLFNPRNTNNTQTFFSSLSGPSDTFNSVPDQYLLRGGVVLPYKAIPGLGFSLGARLEGVPVNDAFGGSDGFRRPGYSIFVEPGVSYSRKGRQWGLSVPIATYRNVQDNPRTERREDATLADFIVLFSYSQRFGAGERTP